MRWIAFLFVVCFLPQSQLLGLGQTDFQNQFNQIKNHLSNRKFDKALPMLQQLHQKSPHHANINYLIGVCQTENQQADTQTLEHLKRASTAISINYDPNSALEDSVPVYAYYYLCLAYAQNNQCQLAKTARESFLAIDPFKDSYYINDSEKWLASCNKQENTPLDITEKAEDQKIGKGIAKAQITTRTIEYSTSLPLYGVQIGAFKEVVPVNRFAQLKNVAAFLDKDGWMRYIVGTFSIPALAERLKEHLIQDGYPDAFIVNVNDERKFSEEILDINQVSIKENRYGEVNYHIQVGAFQQKVDHKTAEVYLLVDGVKSIQDGDLTRLIIGNFDSYQEAKQYQHQLPALGIDESFIIAFHKERQISLAEAAQFVSKTKRQKKKSNSKNQSIRIK